MCHITYIATGQDLYIDQNPLYAHAEATYYLNSSIYIEFRSLDGPPAQFPVSFEGPHWHDCTYSPNVADSPSATHEPFSTFFLESIRGQAWMRASSHDHRTVGWMMGHATNCIYPPQVKCSWVTQSSTLPSSTPKELLVMAFAAQDMCQINWWNRTILLTCPIPKIF